jgi:hypothetical protein
MIYIHYGVECTGTLWESREEGSKGERLRKGCAKDEKWESKGRQNEYLVGLSLSLGQVVGLFGGSKREGTGLICG